MNKKHVDSLALTLLDIGAVRFGQFKLHSGRTSPIYVDLRVLVSHPKALWEAAAAYATLLPGLNFDLLAAIPYGGFPIGVALSLHSGEPMIYPRKEVKAYGTSKGIEGVWQPGQNALIVEDIVTSGQAMLEGARRLQEAGLVVTDALVLIDREQGGRENLAAAGLTLHAVTTLKEILASLLRQERITPEQQAEVVQALWV